LPSTLARIMQMSPELFSIDDIPEGEFEFSFARSGGPGGQNVNKVSSKALLRWAVASSPSLPADIRYRFLRKFAARLTLSGEVLIASQKYRDQNRNADDCLLKLQEMVASVASPPTPRIKTKPGRAAVQRRIESKRKVSAKKVQRRAPLED
jgi:ribosome-associated protein